MKNEKLISSAGDITLLNPKFFGLSADRHPYSVLSKEGVKINKNLVELAEVYSDIALSNNNFIAFKSDKGFLKLESDNIELSGHVEILVNDTYNISTEQVFINLKKRSGYGNNLVKVTNVLGNIIADEFEITENHREVIFKGNPVKTIINNINAVNDD